MITAIEKPSIKISDTLQDSGSSGIAKQLNRYNVDITDNAGAPADIFYFESNDDQMRYFGIRKESLIVVNRAIDVTSDMIIVCCVDGEWLTRKMIVKGNSTFLCINDGMDARLNITGKQIDILGAVIWVCQPVHQS